MRHSRSVPAALLAVLPLLATFTAAGPAQAATLVWPSFDCFHTLQQCVDVAAPGDVVEVVPSGPLQESIRIDGKSLTLRPYPGSLPVFASPHNVEVFGGSAPVEVTIQGFTFASGRLILRQAGIGVFDVRVLDNTIQSVPSNESAIEVSSGNSLPAYGQVFFDVSRNRISIAGTSASEHTGISVGGFSSAARGKIVGNTILQAGVATPGSLIRVSGSARSTTVDVIGNELRGVFNAGIDLHQAVSGGKLGARVINNLVVGQVNVAGAVGGIVVHGSRGTTTAYVVNNTVASGERGVSISGRADLGARLFGHVANNVVICNREVGISIDANFQTTFVNEHNLSFRNAAEAFVPGPGTLFTNPMFVTPNDFRLSATSPIQDTGSNARVPADIIVDLAGAPRIQGAAVAMGAYER